MIFYILFHLYCHHLYGYSANSQRDQLPVGLIVKLVEHCTSIPKFMGSKLVQAVFFLSLISKLLKLYTTTMIIDVFAIVVSLCTSGFSHVQPNSLLQLVLTAFLQIPPMIVLYCLQQNVLAVCFNELF